ncbi:response regulator [bacterium]|nr:response regulator [bacterium]
MQPSETTRVLLVEDNEDDTVFVKAHLRRIRACDYSIQTCTRLADAEAILAAERFHLVLLDMSLPDGEGVLLVDRIRKRAVDTPIVVLTANNDEPTAIEALRRGAQDYLIKGELSSEILQRVIRYSVERHAMAREMERANQELQELSRQAEAANQLKSEFLAKVSHELRTPLTAILGFTDLVLDHELEPEVERASLTIKQNGQHLLSILNDILDLSKIEAGHLRIERSDCSPGQIIEEVISLLRVRATAKGIDLRFHSKPDVPARIQSDPLRIRQIMLNLIGNAIKFTERGFVQVNMSTVELEGKPQLRIDVSDTGIGMTPEQLDRLFQPFVQADASITRQFGGTGLGLTICRRLLELMDGHISASSRPELGSTFQVVFPLHAVEDSGQEYEVSTRKKPTETPLPSLDGVHVLMAEDGIHNRTLISLMLKKAGARVSVVENGQLAVDAIAADQNRGNGYQIILMDMQMPVLDGYSATAQIRANGCSLPVIALTANVLEDDVDKCRDSGCDDFLAKPVNRRDLVETIARHVLSTPPSNGQPVAES